MTPLRRPFYGWVVVGAVFMVLAVSSGLGFYGLAVYLRALTVEQGFGVGAVSGATALFFAVTGLVGLPVARLIADHDARWTIGAGGVIASVALLMLGRVHEVWQLYPVYALFGMGFAASGLVPGTTLVTRWFARRRSVALSVASTGLSAGGVVVTPVVALLVEHRGLAAVAPLLALVYLLGVVPVAVALVRPDPAAMGMLPDGAAAPEAAIEPGPTVLVASPDPVLLAEARRTRFYRTVTGAHSLAMLAQVGGIAHLYSLVAERATVGAAGAAVSVLAVSSLLGRLVGGVVAARVDLRTVYLVLLGVQAVALLGLALGSGTAALLAAAALFGLTVGNLLMLHPLLLVERFGVTDYPRIYSRSQLAATLGVAAGPSSIGALHDVVGGYGAAFTMAGVASVLAAAVGPSPAPRDRPPSATGDDYGPRGP